MAYKLVAIDIDGTLLNDQRQLTPAVKAAIAKAKDQGVKIVIASGRPMTGVRGFLKELHLDGQDDQYVICFNGALGETTSGREIVRSELTYDDYLDLELFFRKLGARMHVETPHYIYTANQDISPYTVLESYIVSMPVRYRTLDQMAKLRSKFHFMKLMGVDDPAVLQRVEDSLPQEFKDRFAIMRSEDYFLEFVNKDAGKGNAMVSLGKELGISPSEMLALGNAQNDESMLAAAGLGVAMGNSVPHTRQMADVVTADNNHDGVAKAIEKYVLK